jgi:hypothetical protein
MTDIFRNFLDIATSFPTYGVRNSTKIPSTMPISIQIAGGTEACGYETLKTGVIHFPGLRMEMLAVGLVWEAFEMDLEVRREEVG